MPEIMLDSLGGLVLVLILGLATSRLTSLVVNDAIFERVRHEIFLLSPPNNDEGDYYTRVVRIPWLKRKNFGGKDASRIDPSLLYREPGLFGSLIACSHCVGVWAAAILVASLFAWPFGATLLILVLAVAQVHEFVHSWARL